MQPEAWDGCALYPAVRLRVRRRNGKLGCEE